MSLIVRWASRQNARHVALGTIQRVVENAGGARLMTRVLINDMMLSPCKIAGSQCDAREAGLARVFEMDDRWFRLGDHGRYSAQLNCET